MASALSKRQQARNEKVLQELVHNVPGNNLCADCQARNPGWASWSLGVFLCMRCASIHRKLGTHISKVKSLTMDGWSNEQVENMKKVGNITSNKIYNSENKKPSIPVDADEADSAMERFIRSKYVNNKANHTTRQKSANRALDEGTPPPLPPKTPSKFSFRSASSILPLSSRSKKETRSSSSNAPSQPNSPRDARRSPSPVTNRHLTNKPSRVFGASVQRNTAGDEVGAKLARLRDMGFTDSQRNAAVLKGVDGNLERAIETLVRLGEGDRRSPAPPSSTTAARTLRTSRSMNPVIPHSAPLPQQPTFPDPRPLTPLTASSNPFDLLPPQTAQSTGTLQSTNPFLNANPYGSHFQHHDMNQAFASLSLAPPQPLFPHHTGGLPAPGTHQGGNTSPHSPYQQMLTTQTQSYQTPSYANTHLTPSMTYPQPVSQQRTGTNPFMGTQTQTQPQALPAILQPNLAVNITNGSPSGFGNNPFARSPTKVQSPALGQIPEQSQYTFASSPQPLSPTAGNPFFVQSQPQPQPQQQPMPVQQQQQQQSHNNPFATAQPAPQNQYYNPQRADKASILSLYNQSHYAPQPDATQGHAQSQATTPAAEIDWFQASAPPGHGMPQRSASMPLPAANKNPFYTNGTPASSVQSASLATAGASATADVGAPAAGAQQKPNVSRESMAFADMNWANGRHSPDAFASLSSRYA
ncbi:hypothetical protein ACRALDRAFT_2099612 [Sodiomyces alcalophilus JCM 7366]|uniref:uncharacterized protein n=1 Tax=Sodiomyces alcalophilus JCM 7366 TaxID=591952 RepID=UPI0039B5EF14